MKKPSRPMLPIAIGTPNETVPRETPKVCEMGITKLLKAESMAPLARN